MERRFEPALRTLQNLLQDASLALQIPIPFALIGGLALSAWGVVRATQDIDFLADSNPSPLRNLAFREGLEKFLRERGCMVEWRVGEPDDPIPLLLRLELPRPTLAPAADILWAHKRWLQEALIRKIAIRISHLEVFVLHPEDLILMKIEAGGPQDLLDVQALLSNPVPELDLKRLKRKAAQLRLGAILNRCLRHSRGE
ncbi:MAG: DUF6036 family nucleotidyltransferase [Candidatus Binatia bacterium]